MCSDKHAKERAACLVTPAWDTDRDSWRRCACMGSDAHAPRRRGCLWSRALAPGLTRPCGNRRCRRSAAGLEELPQERRGFVGQDATRHVHLVICLLYTSDAADDLT